MNIIQLKHYLRHFDNVMLLGNPVTKVQIQAKEVNATDTAFTVLGEDVEVDDMTFSMVTCTPTATCPFTMTPSKFPCVLYIFYTLLAIICFIFNLNFYYDNNNKIKKIVFFLIKIK